jgi:hypothetical protein
MRHRIVVATCLTLSLAACSSSGSSSGITVSASAARPATAALRAARLDAGNGVVVDRIRVVVRKFEVEGEPACGAPSAGSTGTAGTGAGLVLGRAADRGSSGSESSGKDDGECEIESGPFLVDLAGDALATGVHPVTGIDVPAGTYEELRFDVHVIDVAKAGQDAGLLAMAQAGASILVNGTVEREPFEFRSAISVSQKREGTIVVDPNTGANVTLDLDPSGWFQAADGSRLSPTDPAARAAIEAAIQASVRVVHDDDEDGEDDETEGHGGSDDLRAAAR